VSRPVRWSTNALTDLADQVTYIAAENPSAARRVADAIDRTALALGDTSIGRPGRVTGTYEKAVTGLPYVLTYVITQTGGKADILAYAITQTGGEEAVAIARVIHTARDWSAETWPD
jgi:plasmid stabilization system protein ParE